MMRYALRHIGSTDFVSRIPYDFTHLVHGWEAPEMLTWGTLEEAETACARDPNGETLMVEEVLR